MAIRLYLHFYDNHRTFVSLLSSCSRAFKASLLCHNVCSGYVHHLHSAAGQVVFSGFLLHPTYVLDSDQ